MMIFGIALPISMAPHATPRRNGSGREVASATPTLSLLGSVFGRRTCSRADVNIERQISKRRTQRVEFGEIRDDLSQRGDCRGNVSQERSVAFCQPKKAICSKRLHEALHSTKPKPLPDLDLISPQIPAAQIVQQELITLGRTEMDIRSKQQRSQGIVSQPWTHSPEIDQ